MKNLEFLENTKSQSTWKLFGLGLITFGIYYAHYIKNTTDAINSELSVEKRISNGFINTILLICYASVLFSIIASFVEESYLINIVSDVITIASHIVIITWALKAKNRVNEYCELDSKTYMWLSGFWSFVFPPLYFNYKVNGMAENMTHPNFVVTP